MGRNWLRVNTAIPKRILLIIDYLIEKDFYASRSDFVREVHHHPYFFDFSKNPEIEVKKNV